MPKKACIPVLFWGAATDSSLSGERKRHPFSKMYPRVGNHWLTNLQLGKLCSLTLFGQMFPGENGDCFAGFLRRRPPGDHQHAKAMHPHHWSTSSSTSLFNSVAYIRSIFRNPDQFSAINIDDVQRWKRRDAGIQDAMERRRRLNTISPLNKIWNLVAKNWINIRLIGCWRNKKRNNCFYNSCTNFFYFTSLQFLNPIQMSLLYCILFLFLMPSIFYVNTCLVVGVVVL